MSLVDSADQLPIMGTLDVESAADSALGRADVAITTVTELPSKPTITHTYNDSMSSSTSDIYKMDLAVEMRTKLATLAPPMLPERSSRRASRLLDNLMGDLKSAGVAVESPTVSEPAPLDAYLSSEEETSSSADDFSDFEYDFGSEGSDSPMRRPRSSHEDLARVVSVVYSGKPSIIELASARRTPSPILYDEKTLMRAKTVEVRPVSVMLPSTTISSSSSAIIPIDRRLSISSASTSSITPQTFLADHQPHHEAVQHLPTSLQTRSRPAFLKIDPFAGGSWYQDEERPSLESAKTPNGTGMSMYKMQRPKTPTQLLHGVARSLSIMKKKSLANLQQVASDTASNRSYTSAATPPSIPQSWMDLPGKVSSEGNASGAGSERASVDATASTRRAQGHERQASGPVTYGDIMRAAKRTEKLRQALGADVAVDAGAPEQAVVAPERTQTAPPATDIAAATAGVGRRNILHTGLAAKRRMSIKFGGKLVV